MEQSIVVTVELDKNDIERARINGGVPVLLPPNIRDYRSAKIMISVVQDVVFAGNSSKTAEFSDPPVAIINRS